MTKRIIIYSAYSCDPSEVSEKYVAFIWLQMLLKQFTLILLTTKQAEASIKAYYNNTLPANLQIIGFEDNYPFKGMRIIRNTVQLGYFFFNYKINRYLCKNPQILNSCDLIFQKTPESYRHFTSLVNFQKPVYIGPLGGGLKPPKELKGYFKKEPLLYKFRNLDALLLRLPVYQRQFLKARKILVAIDYLDDILPKEYLKNKRVLMNSGVNCSQFPHANLSSQTTNIIFVGRLTRYKGAELLIRAIVKLKGQDFKLHIFGEGEESRHLKDLVVKLDLAGEVNFHGFVHPVAMKPFYQAATIFCLPTFTESLGIAFLEAMACGLPIVTIDNGGPKFICPSQGAIKIPIMPESDIINVLTESIQFLIKNPDKAKEMGRFNRQYCQQHYDWQIIEKEVLDFFKAEIKLNDQL